jgi:hypothetical protein
VAQLDKAEAAVPATAAVKRKAADHGNAADLALQG